MHRKNDVPTQRAEVVSKLAEEIANALDDVSFDLLFAPVTALPAITRALLKIKTTIAEIRTLMGDVSREPD